MDILKTLSNYDKENITIGVLWGHSALDVCSGAKKYGFKTVCVARKWREQTYLKYYKSRKRGDDTVWCIDEVIIVDDFSDIVNEDVQEKLRSMNTIFIHNRYFWVYCDFNEIENNFNVPIYWSRELLKLEEKNIPKNQYYLLEKAGIRIPKIYKTPILEFNNGKLEIKNPEELMDQLTLTKVNNAIRTYERENFVSSSWEEWKEIAESKLNKWEIAIKTLQVSVIEEFVLWAQINFNFFHSMIHDEVELSWTDMRRQTSLDGWLRLPAKEQLKINAKVNPHHIETGHVAVTCKESLIEKAFIAAENFVKTCKEEAQELIGPFALQGAIETDGKKEELVVFDVSMRIPGSPWISATPYTEYLYWNKMSVGERIAKEIREALNSGKIDDIVT